MASSPKLSGIDLTKLLTPAATLRPRAAQRCVTKQDHGLSTGLDVHLIPHCRPALVDKGEEPEPVYVEMAVQNVHRAVGTTLSYEVTKRFGANVSDDGVGGGGVVGVVDCARSWRQH
jgi:glutamate synthase (NADPH/NADH)